jgi:hypothetical protein
MGRREKTIYAVHLPIIGYHALEPYHTPFGLSP